MSPFASVEQTADEIRVSFNIDMMDDEAQRFFCEAQAVGLPLRNVLAVGQNGGTWERRELAGKWAYGIFSNVRVYEV